MKAASDVSTFFIIFPLLSIQGNGSKLLSMKSQKDKSKCMCEPMRALALCFFLSAAFQ